MDIDTEQEVMEDLHAWGNSLSPAEIESQYIDKSDPDWRSSFATSWFVKEILWERVRAKNSLPGVRASAHYTSAHEGPQYRDRIADAVPRVRDAILNDIEIASTVRALTLAVLADNGVRLDELDPSTREQRIQCSEVEVLGDIACGIHGAALGRLGAGIVVHPIFL